MLAVDIKESISLKKFWVFSRFVLSCWPVDLVCLGMNLNALCSFTVCNESCSCSSNSVILYFAAIVQPSSYYPFSQVACKGTFMVPVTTVHPGDMCDSTGDNPHWF